MIKYEGCSDSGHVFQGGTAERMGEYGVASPAIFCVKCGEMRAMVVNNPNGKSPLSVVGFQKA